MSTVPSFDSVELPYPTRVDISVPCCLVAFAVEEVYDYEPSDLLGYRASRDEAHILRHYRAEESQFANQQWDEPEEEVPYSWDGILGRIVVSLVYVPVAGGTQ